MQQWKYRRCFAQNQQLNHYYQEIDSEWNRCGIWNMEFLRCINLEVESWRRGKAMNLKSCISLTLTLHCLCFKVGVRGIFGNARTSNAVYRGIEIFELFYFMSMISIHNFLYVMFVCMYFLKLENFSWSAVFTIQEADI